MKKILSSIFLSFLIFTTLNTNMIFASNKEVLLFIDSEKTELNDAIIFQDNTYYFPFIELFEELGFKSSFNLEQKILEATREDLTLKSSISDKKLKINDKETTLTNAPKMIGDKIFVDISFVEKLFDLNILKLKNDKDLIEIFDVDNFTPAYRKEMLTGEFEEGEEGYEEIVDFEEKKFFLAKKNYDIFPTIVNITNYLAIAPEKFYFYDYDYEGEGEGEKSLDILIESDDKNIYKKLENYKKDLRKAGFKEFKQTETEIIFFKGDITYSIAEYQYTSEYADEHVYYISCAIENKNEDTIKDIQKAIKIQEFLKKNLDKQFVFEKKNFPLDFYIDYDDSSVYFNFAEESQKNIITFKDNKELQTKFEVEFKKYFMDIINKTNKEFPDMHLEGSINNLLFVKLDNIVQNGDIVWLDFNSVYKTTFFQNIIDSFEE